MKTFGITIPTKTYLRKYIHKRYGYPVVVNNTSLLGTVVLSILEKKKVYSDFGKPEQLFNRYSSFKDRLEMVVPAVKYFNATIGMSLPSEKVVIINRYFEHQFEEDLFRFCMNNVDLRNGKHPGYDKSIEKFAAMHGLEFDVDITFECLKKMEYRYRKNLERKSTVSVPCEKPRLQPSLF